MPEEHLVTQAVEGLLSNDWSVVVAESSGSETSGLMFNMDVDRLAQSKGYSLFQYNARTLTKSELVERVEKLTKELTKSGSASSYSMLCDYLKQLRSVVIVIHQSESLSNELLSILSKLHFFSKRQGLTLKLLLVGNTRRFTNLFNAGMVVDKSYSSLGKVEGEPFKSTSHSNKGMSHSNSEAGLYGVKGPTWKSLPVVCIYIVLALPALYFLFWNSAPETSMVSQKPPIVIDETQSKSLNITETQTKPESKKVLLAAIRDSRLRDMEMQRTFIEIEKKYGQQASRYNHIGVDHYTADKNLDELQHANVSGFETKKKNQIARTESVVSEVDKGFESHASNESSNLTPKAVSLVNSVETAQEKITVMMSEEMLTAIKRNDKKKIRALFEAGEPVAAVNEMGETMLLMAAWLGNESLIDLALEYGVPTNKADKKGNTPLFYTAIAGNFWLSKVLLGAGADVNTVSSINKTPLMAAVRNRHRDLTILLLEHGADVNVQDHSGWSALFYAAWNDDLKLTNELLKHGAKKSIKDNDNYIAHDIAVLRKSNQTVSLLK